MSDFLQAIDVITKLLPQIKSLTGARRREYFNEIFGPLFTSLETVHDFYHELFLDTRQEIVMIGWDSQIFLEDLTEPLSKKQLVALRRLWNAYERKRRKDMRLRDGLRQDAHQLLARISWPEERAFLVALGDYFLGDRDPPLTYRAIELQAINVARYGGDSHWSTPSSELYLALSESINLTSTLSALDEMRHRLNERYMNVRLTFKTVQHNIIERT